MRAPLCFKQHCQIFVCYIFILIHARWVPLAAGGDFDLPFLFELSEGDTLPFTSLESYEYDSDSDLDDDDFIKNNNPSPVDNESHEGLFV